MRRLVQCLWATVALLAAVTVQAADYDPPTGFNGHAWREPLLAFPGLVLYSANTATGFAGKVTEFSMQCTPDPPTSTTCSYLDARMVQRVEGAGSHAVAEYYQRQDSNPWQGAGVSAVGVTYLYCARGVGNGLPKPLQRSLTLCGARAYFESDTDEVRDLMGPDHQTNLQRLMRKLVADHGVPPGYSLRGRVLLEELGAGADGKPSPEAGERVTAYRWCGLKMNGREIHPTCPATVSLLFDGSTGRGLVLYATAPLYDYAWARHDMGDTENEMFVLLSGQTKAPIARAKLRECTGSRVCGASNKTLSAKTLRDFQP